jgi:epoxide hydrolase-like predicted phosphatase
MSIRAVITDFGGVLIRSENPVARRKWETRLGLPEGGVFEVLFGSPASERATVGDGTEDEVWQELRVRLGLSAGELADFQRDIWSDERFNAEWMAFLQGLRPRYKIAILSNAWPGAREGMLNHFHLADQVDDIVISAEVRVAKPDPRIYHITAEHLGIHSDEAVFVDDLRPNVLAADALGMKAVQFKSTDQAIADVRAYLAADGEE